MSNRPTHKRVKGRSRAIATTSLLATATFMLTVSSFEAPAQAASQEAPIISFGAFSSDSPKDARNQILTLNDLEDLTALERAGVDIQVPDNPEINPHPVYDQE